MPNAHAGYGQSRRASYTCYAASAAKWGLIATSKIIEHP